MFGISLSEIALIAVVALVVVGPQKLPGMLRTIGQWMGKLRRLTTEVRAQTGIDDILRQEGIDGGLSELRGILRGDLRAAGRLAYPSPADDPYQEVVEIDAYREYPPEGADSYGALADDLVDDEEPEEDALATDSATELAAVDAGEPAVDAVASEAAEDGSSKAPPWSAEDDDAAKGDT